MGCWEGNWGRGGCHGHADALKDKDLKRALGFLKSIQTLQDQNFSSSQSSIVDSEHFNGEDGELEGLLRREKNWEVLDAYLNADDMKLVVGAYEFLQSWGFLLSANFGKCKNIGEFLSFVCDLVELDD
ncbi:hypothetical protein Sjap_013159 [Stephania japonica]|uniref:Uncharacterized protein n=1 Tax=Stephania japonica TaxID=461633 RepID=A0AAP0IZC6_9MAGN